MHWWTVLTWQLILGGIILSFAAAIFASFNPESYVSALQNASLRNVGGLLWVIVLNTALGYGMYVWLLQRMSVVDFTFGGIANPVAGIVSGLVLMGESFTPLHYSLMLGMILMSLVPQLVMSFKQKRSINHAKPCES